MLDRPDAKENAADQQTEKMAREAIEEARMVLPGIQALFGFQLMAVFNQRFNELTASEQVIHYIAVLLMALAIGMIMTPAAYHRQVEPGSVSELFVRLASRLVAIAMLPLAVALCLEVYLLGRVILTDPTTSSVVAGMLLLIFAGLWYLFPWWVAVRQKRGGR
jgi:Family of unknown function (DUF6328)